MVHSGLDVIGFREAKSQLYTALMAAIGGEVVIHHETRPDASKNQLALGQVSYSEVLAILLQSNGNQYEEDDHHTAKGIRVHILRNVSHQGQLWYLKWYRVEPNVIFISVHT